MFFTKVLIANRGEIACRVIRTAKQLGYHTVAVYSDADCNAPHTQLADEAIHIGESNVSASYLSIDKIIAAAKTTGADAIHPGYGFLSENEDFATACANNQITFIGPPANAIYAMGSKRQAKIMMLKAGVPCVPGYEGDNQDEQFLAAQAEKIGLPVMIKASAGGGGRGMRCVTQASELLASIRTARSEAQNAFGSGELILEKAVINPRHVEIQVFADQHGNCVYLGERDCSIQRRHQKVVEEAPCPVMTPELRQAMGEAAVAAAKAVNYVGAGTVEFLLDNQGEFYFLEMNTRLQVEHPVTELITGQDLVAWQLRVAAGEPLPLRQEQIQLNGHAIEVRLYAEDPQFNYLPQTGKILRWQAATGAQVRIDDGVQTGGEVSPFYDPMIAKVIAWGATRQEAARVLAKAVEDSVLLGLNNNKAYLAQLLRHPAFIAGDTHTGFLTQHEADLTTLRPYQPQALDFALAGLVLALNSTPNQRLQTATLPAKFLLLTIGEQKQHVQVTAPLHSQQPWLLQVNEQTFAIDIYQNNNGLLRYAINGHRRQLNYALANNSVYLDAGQGQLVARDDTHSPPQTADAASQNKILAPMDGLLVNILAKVGDTVSAGQTLLLLEAMKIEHPLKAPCAGVVKEILVHEKQQVKKRQLLLVIEPNAV
ncbi:MAG TPA: acetyl/propionyl/methylcrotonyl-CoA carboxylase subunit alpha [Agitococcus sp.]|nr:acetyl/propionyl/methylcrotonyl-CoA carboxylase subunit alpha [Agitococcus sp.]